MNEARKDRAPTHILELDVRHVGARDVGGKDEVVLKWMSALLRRG